MALIVFRIFPQVSHHNATFSFAKQLQSNGHRVIYVGNKDMCGIVSSNGFEYYTLQNDIFPGLQPIKNADSLWFIVKNFKPRLRFFKHLHRAFFKGEAFDEILVKLNPDLLLVDSPFVRHALILTKKKIRFAIIETMVSLHKEKSRPPLDSRIVPTDKLFSKINTCLSWWRYFLSWRLRRLTGSIMPSQLLIKKFCTANQINPATIDFNRYLHPGLNHVPELILSPYEFDFPYSKKANQFHIGPAFENERANEIQDWKYTQLIENFAKIKSDDYPSSDLVVYCSFGSAPWRYAGTKSLFKKLVAIFKEKVNWKLILSIGTEMDYKTFDPLPENILVFQIVPQIDVLKRVHLMITHGGMNSINECILAKIPMLVLPGVTYLDQVGNGARVQYHGLGLTGNLQRETRHQLLQKINHLLTTPSFAKNVKQMRNRILQNKNFEKGSDVVKMILNKPVL